MPQRAKRWDVPKGFRHGQKCPTLRVCVWGQRYVFKRNVSRFWAKILGFRGEIGLFERKKRQNRGLSWPLKQPYGVKLLQKQGKQFRFGTRKNPDMRNWNQAFFLLVLSVTNTYRVDNKNDLFFA
jgi:hypothetical protein